MDKWTIMERFGKFWKNVLMEFSSSEKKRKRLKKSEGFGKLQKKWFLIKMVRGLSKEKWVERGVKRGIKMNKCSLRGEPN